VEAPNRESSGTSGEHSEEVWGWVRNREGVSDGEGVSGRGTAEKAGVNTVKNEAEFEKRDADLSGNSGVRTVTKDSILRYFSLPEALLRRGEPAPSETEPVSGHGVSGAPGEVVLQSASSTVNHPPHYTFGRIEVIEAIEDWKLGFSLGNCVKCIARAGKKHPDRIVEDLEKARWYLNREIARLAKGEERV
jgi:hypothetical protein